MNRQQPPECPNCRIPMAPGERTSDGRRWWHCPNHQMPSRSSTLTDRVITQDDFEHWIGAAVADDVPQCPHGHGQMVRRTEADPMSAALGVWYDCPPGPAGQTCQSAALVPSAELKKFHDELVRES